MIGHTRFRVGFNRILQIRRLVGAVTVLVWVTRTGSAATVTFGNNGGLGLQLWNVPANWDTNELPAIIDTAVLPGGVSTGTFGLSALWITDGKLGAEAAVKHLILQPTPAVFSGFAALEASNAAEGGTLTDADIFFGEEGSITLDIGGVGPPDQLQRFAIGQSAVENGALTLNLPESEFAIKVQSSQELRLGSRIVGDGSITFQPINPAGTESYVDIASNDAISIAEPEPVHSIFSGGVTIMPGMTVATRFSSKQDANDVLLSGPFGKGTIRLAGGTLTLNPPGAGGMQPPDVTLRNDIAVTANSVIGVNAGGGDKAVLSGAISLNGNELKLNGRTLFHSLSGLSSNETGTLTFDTSPLHVAGFEVPSGVTKEWGAAVGVGTNGTLYGTVQKTGEGTFAAENQGQSPVFIA